MKDCNINLLVILHLSFILGSVVGLHITELSVPSVVEPSAPLTLSCEYDMGGEELYSVKWYKDDKEFFRYMPHQLPYQMTFPVRGVHLDPELPAQCTTVRCSVHLTKLTTTQSSGKYQCEVSSEAPKFHVAFQSAVLTVAARGTLPTIYGLRDIYSLGDLILINCTVLDADPPPVISWFLHGIIVEAGPAQRTTSRDTRGLVNASRELRAQAQMSLFPAPRYEMLVQCVVTQPGVPGPPRVSDELSTRLFDPAAAAASATRQQLELMSGKGATMKNHQNVLIVWLLYILWCMWLCLS